MAKKHFTKLLCYSSLLLLAIFLNGCSTLSGGRQDGAPKGNIDVARIPNAVPKAEPLCKYGNPRFYYVHGKRQYVLRSAKGYNKVGFASWYGTKFHGQLTSSREPYSLYGMTAASRDLPLPTYVQVTNLQNGRSIIVKVNDRGPFVGNRILDLSYVGAEKLGYAGRGTALVRVTAIDPVLWAQQHKVMYNVASATTPSAIPPATPTEFYLQLGAFADRTHAENYRLRIAAIANKDVYVKTSYHNGNPIYKVQVGPLAATESNQLREKLEAQGMAPGITVTA